MMYLLNTFSVVGLLSLLLGCEFTVERETERQLGAGGGGVAPTPVDPVDPGPANPNCILKPYQGKFKGAQVEGKKSFFRQS